MAAITLIVTSIFVILVPVAYILTIAIQQGLGLLTVIQDGELSLDIIENRIETIGYVIDLDLLYATYQESIAAGLQRLATGTLTVISGLPGLLIGLTVTMFVLFTLLRDGEQFLTWLRAVVPVIIAPTSPANTVSTMSLDCMVECNDTGFITPQSMNTRKIRKASPPATTHRLAPSSNQNQYLLTSVRSRSVLSVERSLMRDWAFEQQ